MNEMAFIMTQESPYSSFCTECCQMLADLTQVEMVDFQIGFTDKGGRSMNLTISDFNAATQWTDLIALGKVFEDAKVYAVPANLSMFDRENNASVE